MGQSGFEKCILMKRIIEIILALTLIMGLGLEASAKKKETRSPEFTEFVNYLNSYSGKEGCAVMELGKFWMGMFKKMAKKEAENEEDLASIKFMENLKAMIMAYYSEAPQELKDEFNSGLKKHLSKMDFIMEDAQDGIHCYVYGKLSVDGQSLENMTMHIPEAGILMCFEGVMEAEEMKNAMAFETQPAQ